MGGGRWRPEVFAAQAAASAERTYDAGFTADKMCDEFNPKDVTTRYSKKGPFNGFRSVITALIGLDVTGSMGDIPRDLLKGKLGSLMIDLKKTYNRPNENLQISFAGVGDGLNDDAPLQVTHFESDNRFAQQLQKIWLEGHGGANGAESYNILWWYAANKTQLNYILEEGRKGILITVGDDNVHPKLTAGEIRKHLDPKYDGGDISNAKLLEAAREQYEVYHIIVTNGASYIHDVLTRKPKPKAQQEAEVAQWQLLLGKENIVLVEEAGVAAAIANIVKRHRPVVKADMTNLSEEEWDKKTKETLTDDQWIEVLSYAVCPLTGKFMNQPGDWNGSKRAYEKEHVINHVRKFEEDPITKKPLKLVNLNFKLNSNIAQLCSDYKPFFDALPESRKIRLVQLALDQMKAADKSVSSSISSPSPVPSVAAAASSRAVASAAPAMAKIPAGSLGIFGNKPAAAPPLSRDAAHEGDNIPPQYVCSISLRMMEDPVFTEDGFTFDRASIEAWFKENSTSPKTNLVIGKKLTPNIDLRSEIKQWKDDEAKKAKVTNSSAPTIANSM
jgi:hypothetical protein